VEDNQFRGARAKTKDNMRAMSINIDMEMMFVGYFLMVETKESI